MRRDFTISLIDSLVENSDEPVANGDHCIDKLPGTKLRICVLCKRGRFYLPWLQFRSSKRVLSSAVAFLETNERWQKESDVAAAALQSNLQLAPCT